MSEPEFIEARTPQPSFTVETAKVLAEVAHNRQKDKLKRPYREHVIAVGDALADFDDDIRIAGYLHDIAEDTPMTRQALLDMGVSERAVDIIERVTKRLHENPDDYQAGIRYIAEDHDATLVKIADNAHNSLPERVKRWQRSGRTSRRSPATTTPARCSTPRSGWRKPGRSWPGSTRGCWRNSTICSTKRTTPTTRTSPTTTLRQERRRLHPARVLPPKPSRPGLRMRPTSSPLRRAGAMEFRDVAEPGPGAATSGSGSPRQG